MKLTRASNYALIALTHMAQEPERKAIASDDIAEARGLPERFLLKVLKPLVGANVLRSIKGPHGGYELAKPAAEISLLDIIEAIDGPIQGTIPPPYKDRKKKSNPAAEKANAPLNTKLLSTCKITADAVRDHLKRVRLSDLAVGKNPPKPKPAKEED
jgi:Rrf2 family protein